MSLEIIEDEAFVKIPASRIEGSKNAFENCTFTNCDFSNAHFYASVFTGCRFEGCNMHLISLSEAGLQDVKFKDCKLSGVDFSKCRDFLFEVNFENCILDNAIFFKRKIKGTIFKDCSMMETDFTEADLTDAKFLNCNLNRAFFDRTILKNADLRSSYNFTIDPDNNNLKKTRFSLHGLPGLLSKYDIKIEN